MTRHIRRNTITAEQYMYINVTYASTRWLRPHATSGFNASKYLGICVFLLFFIYIYGRHGGLGDIHCHDTSSASKRVSRVDTFSPPLAATARLHCNSPALHLSTSSGRLTFPKCISSISSFQIVCRNSTLM